MSLYLPFFVCEVDEFTHMFFSCFINFLKFRVPNALSLVVMKFLMQQ